MGMASRHREHRLALIRRRDLPARASCQRQDSQILPRPSSAADDADAADRQSRHARIRARDRLARLRPTIRDPEAGLGGHQDRATATGHTGGNRGPPMGAPGSRPGAGTLARTCSIFMKVPGRGS